MRPPSLDARLARAAALFPACAYGADIGADHGRLSCYLLKENVCERMCVADLSADSLSKARALLQLHGVSDRADFMVGDGLTVLPRAAEAIAILGMGGRTLSGILLDGREYLRGAALILSAHTEIPLVRQTLAEIQYRIETEQITRTGGRFYVVLRALPGRENYTEKQLYLGPRLMESTAAEYRDYLAWRTDVIRQMRTESAARELWWLKEELDRVCNGEND